MKNFMKNFAMIFVTAVITAAITIGVMVCKFGMINVSSHTDRYVTTCNGVVVSTEDRVETDSIDFDVKVNESYNIFSR